MESEKMENQPAAPSENTAPAENAAPRWSYFPVIRKLIRADKSVNKAKARLKVTHARREHQRLSAAVEKRDKLMKKMEKMEEIKVKSKADLKALSKFARKTGWVKGVTISVKEETEAINHLQLYAIHLGFTENQISVYYRNN